MPVRKISLNPAPSLGKTGRNASHRSLDDRRASFLQKAIIPLGILTGTACTPPTVISSPSPDEEAYALVSTMDHLVNLAQCDKNGVFWVESDKNPTAAMSGRSSGTAGVIKGLLAGISELERQGLDTQDADPLDLEPYVALVESAAQWLMGHARIDTEMGTISWNQCIDVEQIDPSVDEFSCPEGVSISFRNLPGCTAEFQRPSSSLKSGIAGIGDAFLDLSEQTFFSYHQRETFMQYAVGAGNWLLANAWGDDLQACWPVTTDDGPVCKTSLSDGAAGAGYFLLRLSGYVDDGTAYLNGARSAANWLVARSVPDGSALPDAVSITENNVASHRFSGFSYGNAGIAYFLMAMYVETAEMDPYGKLAEELLGWLRDSDIRVSELDGSTWQVAAPMTYPGTFTSFEEGNAGIGWTFLQAAQVFGGGPGDPETTYLDAATQAAAWLTHPEIAHYYQGLVWWPAQIEPWSDPSSTASNPVGATQMAWPAPWQTLWQDGAERTFVYFTGLSKGNAGIGGFLLDLGQALDGLGDQTCYQSISQDVAEQATKWLYYKGRPVGSSHSYWSWYASALRLVSSREVQGEVTPGYDYGISGILAYLAWDRAIRTTPSIWSPYSCLGFEHLVGPL